MKLVITPGFALQGELRLAGDKSLSHRAAVLAALAEGESRIENFLLAGVTGDMLRALAALGVAWRLEDSTLVVEGRGLGGFSPPGQSIDCGNSATTLRLLAGAVAASGVPAVLDGSPGLRRRPMGRIVAPLQAMGVEITAQEGRAPLILPPAPKPLRAISHTLEVASAQVKSCLLLAGLAADGPVHLYEPALSRDHTERMLKAMGVEVVSEAVVHGEGLAYHTCLTPPGERPLLPLQLELPGDISAAAFPLVAALITPGSHVVIKHVLLNPTRTGLLDVLQAMGADLRVVVQGQAGGEPWGDIEARSSRLHGVEVAGELVVRMIDEFPAFAVAAAFAQGRTVVRQARELRYKESDRIAALCTELRCLGASVAETPDGFILDGRGYLDGGQVDSHGDHRLAMALAVAGVAARGAVGVCGGEIVAESFPDFSAVMQQLGAHVETEEGC
ncbi:MAG: 3-phosphoshikimate 1-carboxyvinyltransferase [Anaerolineales bacterium]|nr:3-phosphoshikimate 1-carboxyvinyltransferase [Anaerolineales bacterium]